MEEIEQIKDEVGGEVDEMEDEMEDMVRELGYMIIRKDNSYEEYDNLIAMFEEIKTTMTRFMNGEDFSIMTNSFIRERYIEKIQLYMKFYTITYNFDKNGPKEIEKIKYIMDLIRHFLIDDDYRRETVLKFEYLSLIYKIFLNITTHLDHDYEIYYFSS